jgi:hypothetical protein
MNLLPLFVPGALIAAILLAIEIGRRIGLRRRRGPEQAGMASWSTLDASIFGLMGLFIAFIFYGAGSRFEVRRSLVAEEANAIGTAYLRVDLLPAETQPQIRADFQTYVRSRLAVYQKIPDVDAARAALARSSEVQGKLWKRAVEAARASAPADRSLVLTSLNEMIDITTVRTLALTTHPPAAVFAMLFLTVLMSSILAGYSTSVSQSRDWVTIAAFALVIAAAVYVILDYEYPRMGVIRLDPVDGLLVETLEKMK